MHGDGEFLNANGNLYKGSFHEGKFHGYGELQYVNGDKYEGQFRQGKRHGHGKCRDVDGNVYDGQWCDNKQEGYGVYVDTMDGVYRGQYKNGVREGAGTYSWPEGQLDAVVCRGDQRVGQGVGWSNDRKTAWFLLDGEFQRNISVEEARRITSSIGLDPDHVLRLQPEQQIL